MARVHANGMNFREFYSPPNKFFSAICCDQMAGWIKMPLGKEVGLGPRDIVLAGDPAPPLKGQNPFLQFSAHVCCSQPAGWIKMPLGMEV